MLILHFSGYWRNLCRQEVPIHIQCFNPWLHPLRNCDQEQDATHHCCPTRLFALRSKVPPLRETPQGRQKFYWTLVSSSIFQNTSVHCSPAFRVKVGDTVVFGECRRLSKTVRHNVLKVIAFQHFKLLLNSCFFRSSTKQASLERKHSTSFNCYMMWIIMKK